MAQQLSYEVIDGVAFLVIDNPPVNALGAQLRAELMDAMDQAEEDDAVSEIVLIGANGQFSSGLDIAEYDAGLQAPALRDVCTRVEYSEKPVVAALDGPVYGGGFELALAAHYRIAAGGQKTRLSMPEIRLGLPPSGGASQRLPRMLGAGPALGILLGAGVIYADSEIGRSVVDDVTDGDLRGSALAFCKRLREQGQGPRRTSDLREKFDDMTRYRAELERRRKQIPQNKDTAPAQIFALVEAAPLFPFEAGVAMEEDAFETCLDSDSSNALRYAFDAERNAKNAEMPLPEVGTIAVLGGGGLPSQIVVSALNANMQVHWGTRDKARLKEGLAHVKAIFEHGVDSGGLARQEAAQKLDGLKVGASDDMVNGADMILHAAPGQGNVPAPKDAIRAVTMPGRVDEFGLRFSLPVVSTRLLEVVQGPNGRDEQVAYGFALAAAMGKVPVLVRSNGTSVLGRLTAALHRATDALLDLGLSPYEIDAAVQAWGWRRLPFVSRDTMGLNELATATRAEGAVNWSAVFKQDGRPGFSANKGFYKWTDNNAAPDPDAINLLNSRRPASHRLENQIMPLIIGAMANEGVRMMADGMVQRASDIDVVSYLGLDFPRWRGGPMKAAGLFGLLKLQKLMDGLGHPDTEFWTPDPLWREAMKNGRDLTSL